MAAVSWHDNQNSNQYLCCTYPTRDETRHIKQGTEYNTKNATEMHSLTTTIYEPYLNWGHCAASFICSSNK
jgi:hypothetical protein